MNLKIVSAGIAIVIAIAAVGAVGILTTMSFVQEAEANSCNFNFKEGTTTGSCIEGKLFTDPADDNLHYHID